LPSAVKRAAFCESVKAPPGVTAGVLGVPGAGFVLPPELGRGVLVKVSLTGAGVSTGAVTPKRAASGLVAVVVLAPGYGALLVSAGA
jgi:hypothetical protein